MENIRVRFAPSPTGGLHIGGVRTALFNYLFARNRNGKFILRIEDTDQARYVEGAEQYIRETLDWFGIQPDESPFHGGEFAPYRQSERKEIYYQYAQRLIDSGNAYYAFDTPEELEDMREKLKQSRVANPQYDAASRMNMRNSLTLPKAEVEELLNSGKPYVIRIKISPKDEIRLNDLIRGWVLVHGSTLDDKVIMKSDGMPTYHLANVVDDHLMKISHVIRGEEWLPSAPLHVLLYRYLGWEDSMPQFAHLPLILKPDGNGKLSKRAADTAGFPIFPLSWQDPETQEFSTGFRENGYMPDALLNFLAFLGWNPGTEQELFSKEELIQAFTLDKVNKAGTRFDIDKAKWYNQQYLKIAPPERLTRQIINDLKEKYNIDCDDKKATEIVQLLRERVSFIRDFADASLFLFRDPDTYDEKVVGKKWNDEAVKALTLFADVLENQQNLEAEEAKELFFKTMEANGLQAGKNMQALRLSLTGEGSGPDLMAILSIMGGKSASQRIFYSINQLNSLKSR